MTNQIRTLLLVLRELGGAIPGRIAFQKIIYLLQAMGTDLEYHYKWHYFGPYSEELAITLNKLHFEGLLNDEISRIELESEDAARIYVMNSQLSPEDYANIQKIKPIFRKMQPTRWLELLASIHFIKSISPIPLTREASFSQLCREKPFKFTEDEFNEAWYILTRLGL